jgi:hypothetical protein
MVHAEVELAAPAPADGKVPAMRDPEADEVKP